MTAQTPSPPSVPPAITAQRRQSRKLDISSDIDTIVELAESTKPGDLIVDMAFHKMSDDDTCSGPVSVPVGMSTPQPSCSTTQEPWPFPQPTPVLPTVTNITPACSLPSTEEELLHSDGISPK